MLSAYETSQLFRKDPYLRVQHICDEIEAIHRSIDKVARKVASIEKRIRWLKKIEAW